MFRKLGTKIRSDRVQWPTILKKTIYARYDLGLGSLQIATYFHNEAGPFLMLVSGGASSKTLAPGSITNFLQTINFNLKLK